MIAGEAAAKAWTVETVRRELAAHGQADACSAVADIGYVQQSRDEMEVLFTLLAQRSERGSVMLTNNLPFSKWEQIFKDPMTTAAIDRQVRHSVILELNILSYRLETAKESKTTKHSALDTSDRDQS